MIENVRKGNAIHERKKNGGNKEKKDESASVIEKDALFLGDNVNTQKEKKEQAPHQKTSQ